jgi:hypothetical protein
VFIDDSIKIVTQPIVYNELKSTATTKPPATIIHQHNLRSTSGGSSNTENGGTGLTTTNNGLVKTPSIGLFL